MPDRYPPGLIGLPCGELGRFTDFIPSIVGLYKPVGTDFMKGVGLGPANPLNGIGRVFMANHRYQWLFLTNDDNLCPPDTIYRLLDHNVDVVSGLYFGRIQPFEPIAFDSLTHGTGHGPWFNRHLMRHGESGMIEVEGVGDGCLLIRRHVMEAIPDPWWEYGATLTDACDHDLVFSLKVREAGYKIWCDLDLMVDHIATFAVRPVRKPDGTWEVHLVQGSPLESGGVRSISLPAPTIQI